MSEWDDEECTGRGFGSSSNNYKTNDGDDNGGGNRYGSENDHSGYGDEDSNGYGGDRKFGGGRGRGRGGGRGGRGGGSRIYGDRNNVDNGGVNQDIQYSQILQIIPTDFEKASIDNFLLKVSECIRTANLLEMYSVQRYVMQAYEFNVNAEMKTGDRDQFGVGGKKQKSSGTIPLARSELGQFDEGEAHAIELYLKSFNQNAEIFKDKQREVLQLQVYDEDALMVPVPAIASDSAPIGEIVKPFIPTLELDNLSELLVEPNVEADVITLVDLEKSLAANIVQQRLSPNRQTRKQRRSFCERSTQSKRRATSTTETPQSPSRQSFLPRRYITEREMQLRKRIGKNIFDNISSNPPRNHNQNSSLYCFFPLEMDLLENADTVAISSYTTTAQATATTNTGVSGGIVTTIADFSSSINIARNAWVSSSSLAMPPPQPLASLPSSKSISLLANEFSNGFLNIINDNLNFTIEEREQDVYATPLAARTGSAKAAGFMPPILGDQDSTTIQSADPAINSIPTETLRLFPLESSENVTPAAVVTAVSSEGTKKKSNLALTLPSIKEEEFRLRLTMRDATMTMTSTPLRSVDMLTGLGKQIDCAQSHDSDSGSGSSSVLNNPLLVTQQIQNISNETSTLAIQQKQHRLDTAVPLEVIAESRERTTLNGMETTEVVPPIPQSALPEQHSSVTAPSNDIPQEQPVVSALQRTMPMEDYRRDWYEILRSREVNLRYFDHGTERHTRRRHPRRHVHPPTVQRNVEELSLAGILPPSPPGASLPLLQTCNERVLASSAVDAAYPSALQASSLRHEAPSAYFNNDDNLYQPVQGQAVQEHDNFLLENVDSISTITDNLSKWHHMLVEYKRSLSSATPLLQATYTYELSVLSNADPERLQIKLYVLKELIRNVSFNIHKIATIKKRYQAAIAFNFLLELKSAEIISLSADGQVTLKLLLFDI